MIDGLQEVEFGPFEGQNFNELAQQAKFRSWRRFDGAPSYPEGVESYPVAAERFDAALRAAHVVLESPQRTLVVCHSHVLRAWLIHDVLSCQGGNANHLQVDTGSVTFVAAAAGGWRLHFLNLLPYLQQVTFDG
jgi:broad specificity phosphatase PhoE